MSGETHRTGSTRPVLVSECKTREGIGAALQHVLGMFSPQSLKAVRLRVEMSDGTHGFPGTHGVHSDLLLSSLLKAVDKLLSPGASVTNVKLAALAINDEEITDNDDKRISERLTKIKN